MLRILFAITVLLLMALPVAGAEYVISSLPYTISGHSGDQIDIYRLSGNLSASTSGITISSVSNVILDLGSDTLFYGTSGSDNCTGINFRGSSWSSHPHNVTVTGGAVIHSPGSSTPDRCRAMDLNGWENVVENVDMTVEGTNGKIITGGGPNFWGFTIRDCNLRSNVHSFDRRDLYDAAAVHIADCRGTTNGYLPSYTGNPVDLVHVTIDNCTIETAPHAGIVLYGRAEDGDYVVARLLNNHITIDARNDFYSYPSGNLYHGTANAYGVVTTYLCGRSEISNNVIRSGTNYGGGRGLYFATTRRDIADTIKVYDNDIDIHQGPGDYYRPMPAHGIRIRQTSISYLHIKGNTVTARADYNTATAHTDVVAHAIRWSPTQGTSTNNVIENNTFRAISDGNSQMDGVCAAVVFDQAVVGQSGLIFRNNRLESTGSIYKWGEGNGGADGWLFQGDTLAFIQPTANPRTFDVGHLGNNWDCSDNVVRDAVYLNGTADDDIYLSNGGDLELTIERTLNIRVLGNNDLTVSNADVSITNNYGNVVATGRTDDDGEFSAPVAYRYESRTHGDSTNFNNFRIRVRYSSDSTVITHVISASNAVPVMTLDNTTGDGGEIDTTPPSKIEDLGAIPGDDAGEVVLSWTAPGDDGMTGVAHHYEIKYATEAITDANWAWATLVDNSLLPEPSGTAESITLADLQVGTPYFFAVRAVDDEGQSAVVSNSDQSYVAGIMAPTPTATDVDSANASVVVVADPVESYLNVYYEFELDSVMQFTTAQNSVSLASGEEVTATYTNLQENTVYFWRCRAVATDESFASDWTATVNFNLTGESGEVTFADLLYPTSGATISSTQPTLEVSDEIGSSLVYIQLAQNNQFTSTINSGALAVTSGIATQWTVPLELDEGNVYYWRASTNNLDWSDPAWFRVGLSTAAAAPEVFAYPNPFNRGEGHESITFTNLDAESELTVSTVSGVVVLYRSHIGPDDFIWDGHNEEGSEVGSGVYLYTAESANGTARGKVIVVR